MRRLVIVLCLAAIGLGVIPPPAGADSATDARRRSRSLRAELDDATARLEATQEALHELDQQLAFDRRQAALARRRLAKTRTALAGQLASLYRSGGLLLADAVLGRGAAAVPDRIELATVLVTRQVDVIADTEAAAAGYDAASRRVAQGQQRARTLRALAEAAVGRLSARLREAQAVIAREAARAASRSKPAATAAAVAPTSSEGVACLLAAPYSYVDSWGAPRSGGRRHEGTDVMAPYGAKVFAYTDGVISRESSNTYGGITLYLQGDNGVEYYYAHLSGYAVGAGTRVRAGQHIAFNGQSGNARYSAPHVHFEVHPGGPGSSPVNPYPYVRRACG